jgi:hypothetical protein
LASEQLIDLHSNQCASEHNAGEYLPEFQLCADAVPLTLFLLTMALSHGLFYSPCSVSVLDTDSVAASPTSQMGCDDNAAVSQGEYASMTYDQIAPQSWNEKRSSNRAAERRYRTKIDDAWTELQSAMPELNGLSRRQVLEKSATYIKYVCFSCSL